MSNQSKTHLYQNRRFNDLFNDTLVFVFRNVLPITKMVMIFVGPMVLLYGTFVGLFSYALISNNTFQTNQAATQPGYMAYLMSGFSVISFILVGLAMVAFYLTLNSFILRYGESTEGKVTVKEVWEDFKAHYLHFLGLGAIRGVLYMLLATLVSWVGTSDWNILLALLFGGIIIYLGVSTSLADIIRMNEGGSVIHALKRSFKLVNTSWWATFGLYLLLGIVNVLIILVLSALSSAVISSMGIDVVGRVIGTLISLFIFTAIYSSFMAMFWVAGTLQYFNLSGAPGRGSSTEYLIDQIGKTQEDSLI